jgi:hypothetical protein
VCSSTVVFGSNAVRGAQSYVKRTHAHQLPTSNKKVEFKDVERRTRLLAYQVVRCSRGRSTQPPNSRQLMDAEAGIATGLSRGICVGEHRVVHLIFLVVRLQHRPDNICGVAAPHHGSSSADASSMSTSMPSSSPSPLSLLVPTTWMPFGSR